MPKKMTQRDRLIAALEAEGSVKTPEQPSRKYVRMTRLPPNYGYYFIGASGALRVGPTRTGSIPASESRKAQLLSWIPQ